MTIGATTNVNSAGGLEDGVATGAISPASGSALLVIGTAFVPGTTTAVTLTSVTDDRGNTWSTPTNYTGGDSYAPAVWYAIAHNVASGATNVTVNLSSSSGNRLSAVIIEIPDALSASSVETSVTGTDNTSGTTVSTSATSTLSQADNYAFLIGAGYLATPSLTSGYTLIYSNSNGTNTQSGVIIQYKEVAATTALTGTVTHSTVATRRHAMLVVVKKAVATGKKYKFQFDTATFTSADTGITGYVWRNVDPDQGVAQRFTGLSGHATAGDLIITSANGVPDTAQLTDTLKGIFYNGTDTSGLVSGTVEDA